MADRSIVELNEATELLDSGLTVVYQNEETLKISGTALKTYARQSVQNYANQAASLATEAAQAAASSAQSAQAAAETAANNASNYSSSANTSAQSAAQSATSAQTSQEAIENMTVSASTLDAGSAATVTKTIINDIVNLAFGLPRGDKGETGAAGSSISNIERTSGTGAPGTTDTYTITLTDGTTFQFQVYNGADGYGSGDMTKATYDANNVVANAGGIEAYVANNADENGAARAAVSTHDSSLTAHNSLFAEKISEPNPKSEGQVLTYNGLAWVAQDPQSGSAATQYTATFLSTGWAADANGYQSQTLTVTGLLASYDVSPDVDVSLSGTDTAGDTATLEGFACISIVTTGADTLTAKCIGDAPSVNVPVIIRVFS